MTSSSPRSRSRLLLSTAAATSVLALMLAGCSQGNGDATSDSSPAAGGSAAEQPQDVPSPAKNPGLDSGGGDELSTTDQNSPTTVSHDVAPVDLVGAALIKTGAVTLESHDVGGVVAKIDTLAVTTGGQISSEETSTNRDGEQVRSRLELQVPVARFDEAVERIASFGVLVSKTRSSEDVTTQVADVNSRVTSARDSIAQLQTLFARATGLGQVITLERELSQREADLESLQAQQRSLSDRTSMSTIVVNVSQLKAEETATNKPDKHGGFVSGIKKGWHALVTFVVVSSHGLGLVLPFGMLGLLVAFIARFLVRRFMPRLPPRSEPRPSE